MLKWHKNYYIGPGIKNISRIRRRLEHGKPVPGIYLITLADMCPEIVGIAKGKEDAMDLVTEMIQTIFSETGGFEIKEYWKNR